MPWPKTGATQYHAQLGLPEKGRAIKGLVIQSLEPAKRSGPSLLTTVPRGMTRNGLEYRKYVKLKLPYDQNMRWLKLIKIEKCLNLNYENKSSQINVPVFHYLNR